MRTTSVLWVETTPFLQSKLYGSFKRQHNINMKRISNIFSDYCSASCCMSLFNISVHDKLNICMCVLYTNATLLAHLQCPIGDTRSSCYYYDWSSNVMLGIHPLDSDTVWNGNLCMIQTVRKLKMRRLAFFRIYI